MPRPRKPTAILELTGAYKKDPQRAELRVNEPLDNGGIGAAPSYFNEFLREIWDEIVSEASVGVMRRSDRKALEAWVQIVAFIRIGKADSALYSQNKAYAQQFGMTPAARSLVQVPENQNGNEWSRADDELAAERARIASQA